MLIFAAALFVSAVNAWANVSNLCPSTRKCLHLACLRGIILERNRTHCLCCIYIVVHSSWWFCVRLYCCWFACIDFALLLFILACMCGTSLLTFCSLVCTLSLFAVLLSFLSLPANPPKEPVLSLLKYVIAPMLPSMQLPKFMEKGELQLCSYHKACTVAAVHLPLP